MRSSLALVLVLATASVATASERYRLEGVAASASRVTGTLTIASDGSVERTVEHFPGGRRDVVNGSSVREGDALVVTWRTSPGILGALEGGRATTIAPTLYRADGRGGLLGRFEPFEERLVPTVDPDEGAAFVASGVAIARSLEGVVPQRSCRAARILAILATDPKKTEELSGIVLGLAEEKLLLDAVRCLSTQERESLAAQAITLRARDALVRAARDLPREEGAHLVLLLARGARAAGLGALRALVEGLVARDVLYDTLDRATKENRIALAGLARAVAPPETPGQNDAAERAFAQLSRARRVLYPYELIVVPGYTPVGAERVHGLHPIAAKRCRMAADDWRAGKAPFLLTTGGAVHPESTPVIEAEELKAELMRLGVPADRIFVEPKARHSTTNLRNAGRFMLKHQIRRALVVTSAGQSFYFSNPELSTFHARSRKELGYEVGRLEVVDFNRTEFVPGERVREENPEDPFDP